MTRSLHGQGRSRDSGASLQEENRPSFSDVPDRIIKKRMRTKKTLDGYAAFPYVGGCRALVAQLDRATGYEPVGREFESLRAHHFDIMKAYRKVSLFCFSGKKDEKKRLTFSTRTTNVLSHRALVAQLDRATGYEPVGREFESLRAHHSRAKAYEDNLISLFSYPFQSIPQNKGSAAEDSCRCIPIEAVSLPPHTYLLPPLRKRRHPILVNALRPGGHPRISPAGAHAACDAPFSLRN